MNGNDIIPYIEPIFRFCTHRLSRRCDAEDLASEIICHILDGIGKYQIKSLDAWVWRIAHNRYARFIDAINKNRAMLSDIELYDIEDSDYCVLDEESVEDEYETVFHFLHTLSAEYRNIFVDYYIGELSVKKLAQKYSLPETTIKWRLSSGRQKVRERIGENNMDKIYGRINWDTSSCNGDLNPDQYLHTQIARAICLAVYNKPLTVEEISLATGIPAMYIEDELPRLEYGDAIVKTGSKYATNFIIFSLKNRKDTEDVSSSTFMEIADIFEHMLKHCPEGVNKIPFYGNDSDISKLGYILIPCLLRKKIKNIKEDRLNLPNGKYPPRKDGGYGWFIVEETVNPSENCAEYETGCNCACGEGSKNIKCGNVYYYWTSKYFDYNIYHNGGIKWLSAKGIPQDSVDGTIPEGYLSDDDIVRLLKSNLIVKADNSYKLNFACFTREQFEKFILCFHFEDSRIEELLSKWILSARRSFEKFVPVRLHDQINQWLSGYAGQVIGCVMDELIRRGVLEKPDMDKPLTHGVFYVDGDYINC